MCDWEKEEFEEYLLWAEAAMAPARVVKTSPLRHTLPMDAEPATPVPVAAES